MDAISQIHQKYTALICRLDEATLRLWAASEAKALGYGGVSLVSKATGLSRTTIYAGLHELEANVSGAASKQTKSRIRQQGGGRKKLSDTDSSLLSDLKAMFEYNTRGDPTSPLLWTSKSTYHLAKELQTLGHHISPRTVSSLLHQMNYSLQSNRKTLEGSHHPDRDAQFRHIAQTVKTFLDAHNPVISVDSKKKELIGKFKNSGKEWRQSGHPEEVNVHDFPDAELGKVAPYGVYDVSSNEGWVNVGIDHDTAEFAVESIRRWWFQMGKKVYPEARHLLITADCGGSNGYRCRLWQYEFQKLADELSMHIHVCHLPPGTSKWNKIEHRMFCHITANWRGRPLESRQTVVNLLGATTTQQGLHIQAALDENKYATGIKISDEAFATLQLHRESFHGEWNYQLAPRKS